MAKTDGKAKRADTDAARLFSHGAAEDRAYKGPRSIKAPPCMLWRYGTDVPDGDARLWQRRRTSWVLSAKLRLDDRSTREISLNTADPTLAMERLRPHVLKAIAEGKLSPDSKAGRVYGRT